MSRHRSYGRYYGRSYNRRGPSSADSGIMGLIAIIIVLIYILPIYGIIRLATAKGEKDRETGKTLITIGIIIWLVIFFISVCGR